MTGAPHKPDARDWRRTARAWRTRGWMKKPGPYPAGRLAALDALSDVELAATAANPDSHHDVRTEAQRRLVERGASVDPVPVVPGFVPAVDADALRKRFFGLGRALRVWGGVLTALTFLALLVAIGFADEFKRPALREAYEQGLITREEYDGAGRKLTNEEYRKAEAEGVEFDSAFASDARLDEVLLHRTANETRSGRRYRLAHDLGQTGALVLVVVWVSWMAVSFFRGSPARVLLLRKFNARQLARSMQKVISLELRPFGHVTTLSDRYIRKSPFAWLSGVIPTSIPHAILILIWLPVRFVLRLFNKSRWGPAWVGSARDFRNLATRLRDRVALNIEVAMNERSEAFVVRTHDNWWRLVIALLMRSADVIVVDLSNVTDGTEWELEQLSERSAFPCAVLVAQRDREGAARAAMARYAGADARPLHLYAKSGDMLDQAAFRTDMLEAMAMTLSRKARRP
ncbi:MAG: hypothetical protein R3C52_08250 [Hyphomonadaceae bacterium]